jgi:2-keto-4-pentenoate hydratase
MALDDATIAELAEALLQADRSRTPIDQPSAAHPGMDVRDAYAIQQRIVSARIADGERIVGWKVGLTSKVMQQMLGVSEPDHAAVLSGWFAEDGVAIPRADLIAPRVEAEIGFILKAPLRGPGVTVQDVLAATAAVTPCIEVIDSRVRDWKIGLVDTVADMASSARVVVGRTRIPVEGLDLRLIGAVLERNGEVVATGAGAAVLGHPAAGVAWAANTLGPLGVTMEPGHVVIPGAVHGAAPADAGDVFTATFDRLGPVTVRFT